MKPRHPSSAEFAIKIYRDLMIDIFVLLFSPMGTENGLQPHCPFYFLRYVLK